MGIIISRFRKKQSTKEVLEQISKDLESIEEYQVSTQQRQKRIIGYLVAYSIVLYLAAALIFYLYYLPDELQEQLLYSTPFIAFPVIIYIVKRLLTWHYRRKICRNEKKLSELKDRRAQILDQVMETETYKVAKEILEKYAPDQLRRNNAVIGKAATTPAPTSVMNSIPSADGQSDVRRRVLNTSTSPATPPSAGGRGPVQMVRPLPNQGANHLGGPAQQQQASYRSMSTPQSVLPRPGQAGLGTAPGPPMPRPVLPRERGYMDRFIEYLVGDGPANRYALVCRQCESHNGMALKEEFEYLAFRCAYCFYWNPSRKQRPAAPRLEDLSKANATLPPPPLPSHHKAKDDEEGSTSGEEEEEDEDEEEEEDGEGEEDSGSSSGEGEEEEDDEEEEEEEEEEDQGLSSSEVSRAVSSHEGSQEDVSKHSNQEGPTTAATTPSSTISSSSHITTTTATTTSSTTSPTTDNEEPEELKQ